MSIATFIETPRFPEDISYGSGGGPEFKTHVFTVEQRQASWTVARARYDVSYGIRDVTDMDTVRAFFYNTAGKASGFRFKDWSDYMLTAENIGTGDTVETVFQITKTYTTGAETYIRNIKKPVTGIEVYVDAVLQVEGGGSDYTIDTTTGIITFNAAPGVFAITVTGTFDIPVRFDTDFLMAKHDGFETEAWDAIPLIELLLTT